MEASTAFVNVISEDIGFKSNVNGPCCDVGKLCIKHEKVTGSSMGETAMAMSLEDTEGTSITIEDSLMVGLGTTLHDILHVQDVPTGADVHVPTSNDDEIWRPEKHKMCPELEIHKASASVAKTQKSLSKFAAFPSLEEKLSSPVTLDGKEELPNMEQHGQSSLKPEDPTCTRSMSMPPLKLISAMKGGRKQQGTPWKVRLNVTWAPDVYDPPETSLSHTVKSHQQHSRGKKKDYRHRHKGKSARGSSSERKHHVNRRSTGYTGPLHLRPPARESRSLPLETLQPASREAVDFASQKCKCGSSFLRGSLSNVRLSVAEATLSDGCCSLLST
ncbi:uncharacterized protein LOC131243632 [Magnolia sinica]|uniref:uncharacterized protein LOC131243632 n=1 Tax=Magnolia sinica TaxID=86752 RepID=UPI0026581E65|nr:uncharacterized protein LOC131243632 [Magnolia sinica]